MHPCRQRRSRGLWVPRPEQVGPLPYPFHLHSPGAPAGEEWGWATGASPTSRQERRADRAGQAKAGAPILLVLLGMGPIGPWLIRHCLQTQGRAEGKEDLPSPSGADQRPLARAVRRRTTVTILPPAMVETTECSG
ncbi:hypothetical protein KIL84_016767 [Mauremys mutica]|uniref:Uncharacterized protein n=1 Tax=Mauremys mutica TaxID=74926 RepID=A0A9D3X4V6_9SAUR|nr:hypothetical protein KIL84_016767 [Mauremys mutica]